MFKIKPHDVVKKEVGTFLWWFMVNLLINKIAKVDQISNHIQAYNV